MEQISTRSFFGFPPRLGTYISLSCGWLRLRRDSERIELITSHPLFRSQVVIPFRYASGLGRRRHQEPLTDSGGSRVERVAAGALREGEARLLGEEC